LASKNPAYRIEFSDNLRCRDLIESQFDKDLAECFDFIPHGPIKADLWRLCVLYCEGGVYCDIDIEPHMGFDEAIDEDTFFLTSASRVNNYLNPIVLACRASNHILLRCIEEYKRKFKEKSYDYWRWSICPMLYRFTKEELGRDIINGIDSTLFSNGKKYVFMTEIDSQQRSGLKTLFEGRVFCNNHYQNYVSAEFEGGGFQ
jgi:mannosyltransferase OCH1-like enzyme